MRCRKVRSSLSAFCKDELTGSRRLAVVEHLSTCSDCRREESEYRALAEAAAQVPVMSVSKDFNSKLFERLAQERFAETRSKAYLPKRPPLVRWTALVPAVTAACLLLLVGVMVLPGGDPVSPNMADVNSALDDSYLTAQPVDNPNLTVSLEKNWSLSTQMARAERMNNISRRVGPQIEFYGIDPSALGASNVASRSGNYVAPYMPDFFRVRPVVRFYQSPHGSGAREVTQTY